MDYAIDAVRNLTGCTTVILSKYTFFFFYCIFEKEKISILHVVLKL